MKDWLPRSISSLQDYSWNKFAADALAGVTVGLVALPLAMAFAISSGMKPQAGLYCAIVAGFLISALGGSKFQVGGPTGALVVVAGINVETIGSRFGGIPGGWPHFALPRFHAALIPVLISPALTVALL